jgi:hypothetical protein
MLKENKSNEWIKNKIWDIFGILEINDILEEIEGRIVIKL